jgi:2-polyprenyl-3-methyl-5-hydroxy-6-metoxy-1,4-benzoquinol methylase
MFDTIRPYVKGRALEIGSGIGNISSFFVREGIPLTLSDLNIDYCRRLREKFQEEPMVENILRVDLADPGFDRRYPGLQSSFNTVFALNVVEHIENDGLALKNCGKLLTSNGHVIILVPAYPALYNIMDRELQHYRRYTQQSLKSLLSRDFEIIKIMAFNMAGLFGWFFSGSLSGSRTIPPGQLNFYNKLVPLFKIADTLTFRRVGLSLIAIGRKKY